MFKPNKKNLDEPVRLRDFVEFTNDLGQVIGDIVDKKVKESADTLSKKILDTEMRIDNRIDTVETRLEKKITEFKDEILTGQDALSKKLDKLFVEDAAKLARDDRQDAEIVAIQKHIGLESVAF